MPGERRPVNSSDVSERLMPILPAEPDSLPPGLWDDPTAVPRTKAETVWWCLHTKPRQEKATARASETRSHVLPASGSQRRPHASRSEDSLRDPAVSKLSVSFRRLQAADALRGNRLVAVLEVSDQESLEATCGKFRRCSARACRYSQNRPLPWVPGSGS